MSPYLDWPPGQIDEIIEKIYANMSACHIKNQNWKRAVETADKVFHLVDNPPRIEFIFVPPLGSQQEWREL
jgi:hypothetical protein